LKKGGGVKSRKTSSANMDRMHSFCRKVLSALVCGQSEVINFLKEDYYA
jgi:hypothetical protein